MREVNIKELSATLQIESEEIPVDLKIVYEKRVAIILFRVNCHYAGKGEMYLKEYVFQNVFVVKLHTHFHVHSRVN